MAESNENYFDDLPDEMILNVLQNLDGLTDRSKMAQVSHRFNRLAKDKYWRRSIFISKEEYTRFPKDEKEYNCDCTKTIVEEIINSKYLHALTIEQVPIKDSLYTSHLCKISNSINASIRQLSNFAGSCVFRISEEVTHAIYLFTPISKDVDFGRTLRFHPTNTTSLAFRGKDSMMLGEILNLCKETLMEFRVEGEISNSTLRQLGKCKKLLNVVLVGKFNLSNDVNKIELLKIRRVCVLDSVLSVETSYKIRDIFFSDALHTLDISFPFLKGAESEVCSKCPNLKFLTIKMDANIRDGVFKDFCDNLLMHLNNHLVIILLIFTNLRSSFIRILSDSANRNLTVNYILEDLHPSLFFGETFSYRTDSFILNPSSDDLDR